MDCPEGYIVVRELCDEVSEVIWVTLCGYNFYPSLRPWIYILKIRAVASQAYKYCHSVCVQHTERLSKENQVDGTRFGRWNLVRYPTLMLQARLYLRR